MHIHRRRFESDLTPKIGAPRSQFLVWSFCIDDDAAFDKSQCPVGAQHQLREVRARSFVTVLFQILTAKSGSRHPHCRKVLHGWGLRDGAATDDVSETRQDTKGFDIDTNRQLSSFVPAQWTETVTSFCCSRPNDLNKSGMAESACVTTESGRSSMIRAQSRHVFGSVATRLNRCATQQGE